MMVASFIVGFLVSVLVCYLLFNRYLDYRIEKIFPKEIIINVLHKNKKEVPELLKAIDGIDKSKTEMN